jgi:hypothetical protein
MRLRAFCRIDINSCACCVPNRMGEISAQPQESQHEKNDDDQTDNVNDVVHD